MGARKMNGIITRCSACSFIAIEAIILSFVLPAFSQAPPPETLRVPVTFYDFHWNFRANWDQPVTIFRGNPDFNYGMYGSGALVMGMVQDTLDSESKPVLGPTVFYNAGIQYWYRPCDGPKGQFMRPAYRADGSLSIWQSTTYDTVYKNIVIADSLPFILVDINTETYVFNSDSNEPYKSMGGFFPLDGRGFGTEGATDISVAPWRHNYSFTMEVQCLFRYKAGLVFDFAGDDDMWVFINKRLVLDMGGIHSREAGGFALDGEAARLGLTVDNTYLLSVFYVERMPTGANCKITTNITPDVSTFCRKNVVPAQPAADPGAAVDIITISGRLIARSHIPSNGNLALSLMPLHLPAGTYLCKISSRYSSRLKKILLH